MEKILFRTVVCLFATKLSASVKVGACELGNAWRLETGDGIIYV